MKPNFTTGIESSRLGDRIHLNSYDQLVGSDGTIYAGYITSHGRKFLEEIGEKLGELAQYKEKVGHFEDEE
jgi:hypothetical protein